MSKTTGFNMQLCLTRVNSGNAEATIGIGRHPLVFTNNGYCCSHYRLTILIGHHTGNSLCQQRTGQQTSGNGTGYHRSSKHRVPH